MHLDRTGRQSAQDRGSRKPAQLIDLLVDVFTELAVSFTRCRELVTRPQVCLFCYFKQSSLDRLIRATLILSLVAEHFRVNRLQFRHFKSIDRICIFVVKLLIDALSRD